MTKLEDTQLNSLSRRQFVGGMAAAVVGLPLASRASGLPTKPALQPEPLICIFSKHLQWLPVDELTQTVGQLGFNGVDLTVRKGGHVDPANATSELPRAVELLKGAGLQVPMIVTDIVDADHPNTETLLKTAAQLGITYYRTGYLKYDPQIGVAKSLETYKSQLRKLAHLNQKYAIHGAYQNHSGTNVGAAVWDLWELLKEVDPHWMGCQYDIMHATAEGSMSWVNGLDALKAHIRCMDIKDFVWQKQDGKWKKQIVPLGEGMVDFKTYFKLLHQYGITGPFSLHLEYPLGGAESGKTQLTIPPKDVLTAMQRDLQTLKKLIKEAQL